MLKGMWMVKRTRPYSTDLGILEEKVLVVPGTQQSFSRTPIGIAHDPGRDNVQVGRFEIVSQQHDWQLD